MGSLVDRPPELGVTDNELRELPGSKVACKALTAEEVELLGEGDALALNLANHLTLSRAVGGVMKLYGDVLVGSLVVVFQSRLDKGMTQGHLARGVEADATPYTGIAVTDTVRVGEVPAHGHKLGDVPADISITSVAELAHSTPALRLRGTGYIDRANEHGDGVLLADLDKVGNVNIVVAEHTSHGAHEVSVDPDVGSVVDAVGLQPHGLTLKRLGNVKLGAEPVGIELGSYLRDVGNTVVAYLVVVAIIRVGVHLIIY